MGIDGYELWTFWGQASKKHQKSQKKRRLQKTGIFEVGVLTYG